MKYKLLGKKPQDQQPKPFLLLNKETKPFSSQVFCWFGFGLFHEQLGTPSQLSSVAAGMPVQNGNVSMMH